MDTAFWTGQQWKRKWIPLLLDPGFNINAIMQNSTLPRVMYDEEIW
ncbi:hypothetical protein T03_13433 [Trichinella britovi]|uniref:Uncharacterized protein n=1 Tax=Trichinella britovi TaxID=45882 RepID=A0A0V1ALP7_TRIBR|nr:hypothetical protein T03_13433 [Trichinella britovi]